MNINKKIQLKVSKMLGLHKLTAIETAHNKTTIYQNHEVDYIS